MTDLVLASFEAAAELSGDITADVYRRYYARCPEAERLMSHVDPYMQGRMMEEVLNLLMTAPEDLPDGYLQFETANHASYGVVPDLYRPLLEAVRDAVQAAAGDVWSLAWDAAWRQRIDELMRHLLAHAEAAAPDAATAAVR